MPSAHTSDDGVASPGQRVPRDEPPSALQRGWARVIGKIASISDAETKVSVRGFVVSDPQIVARLENIGRHFVWGYNRAVGSIALRELVEALDDRPKAYAGFAYEGAGMGLAISDWLTPRRRLFDAYVSGPAIDHEYVTWVGFGWALARLPISPVRALSRYRCINKWLALDGYGFHEGYFRWRSSVLAARRPRGFVNELGSVFDQGLGRALWFVCGADPSRVAATIGTFDEGRRGDLWAGAGLAAAYAGGVARSGLRDLCGKAGLHAAALAQGVVFAAEARRRANNPEPHVELACAEVLGLSLTAAAEIAIESLPGTDDSLAGYQRWRRTIQERCRAAIPADGTA